MRTLRFVPVALSAVCLLVWGGLQEDGGARAAGKDGHALFDAALKRHVRDGLVDYLGMARDQEFRQYLGWLKYVNPDTFRTSEDEMAFWVNAYNALAIKGVINNYPLRRVIDGEGFFDKNKHAVAGNKYTLDEIEKKILFPKFKEPKLHFVLVCAALSCPALPAEAYTGKNFRALMETVTRRFLTNPKKNRLDRQNRVLYLSKIFQWYEQDFVKAAGSVLAFIKPYLAPDDRRFLEEHEVEIRYLEYDWRLNGK